jgi:hypothetical protein
MLYFPMTVLCFDAPIKKPDLQSEAGCAFRFSSICVGLSPRRPQAGFDWFHQIGATEL